MAEPKTDMGPPSGGSQPDTLVPKFRGIMDRVYKSKKHKKMVEEMDRFLLYFKGDFWDQQSEELKPGKHDSEIYANLFFSTVMTTAPLLTDNKPIWSVRAKKYFMQRYMDTYKPAADYLWETEDMDMKTFRAVLDSLIMKMGLAKVYYDPDKGPFGDVSIDIVDPRTFIMAPGYIDPWEASWCGTITSRPLDWVYRRYPEFRGKLKPDGAKEDEEWGEKDDAELSMHNVRVYDLYTVDETLMDVLDKDNKPLLDKDKKPQKKKKYPKGRSLVFVGNYDKPLDDKPYPYSHGKAPYVPLYDAVVPHEFVGMGECDQIETLVKEFNLDLRKVANFVRRWVDPNFTADANCGISSEQWKADAPGGGNLFYVTQGMEPPQMIDIKPINSTLMDFIAALLKLVEEISGVTDITKGVVSKKQRQSAREIATILETSYTRTRQRVRNLEWFLKRVLYLVLELMQENYSEVRDWNQSTDTGTEYGMVSNSKEFASAAIAPNFKPRGRAEKAEYGQMDADHQKYMELIQKLGPIDKVHAEFDITIETNSTLPMDKQSRANLALKLFELKAIDEEAILETLGWPKAKETVERLIKRQQGQQPPGAPPQGGQPPVMPQGEQNVQPNA